MKKQYFILHLFLCLLPWVTVPGQTISFRDEEGVNSTLQLQNTLSAYKALLVSGQLSDNEKADACLKISRISLKACRQPDSVIVYAKQGFPLADKSLRRELSILMTDAYLLKNDDKMAALWSLIVLEHSRCEKELVEGLNLMLEVKMRTIETGILSGAKRDDEILDEAILLANEIYSHQPESPLNNKRRLELSLLKGSRPVILQAMHDYFYQVGDTAKDNSIHQEFTVKR